MKSGYGKDADSVFRQKGGKFGKNPCQRKIQDTLNAKSFPAVFLCSHVRRNLCRWTDQRRFLIGFAQKAKCTSPIHLEKDRIFRTQKNGVDLFYFHVDVPDKNHGSQNTVLCRQLPAVLPDSITGERCGEASAEFSILLPPRRPYLCAAVALLNLLCVFTHPPFADFEKRPSFPFARHLILCSKLQQGSDTS